jgi:hypothetical protein
VAAKKQGCVQAAKGPIAPRPSTEDDHVRERVDQEKHEMGVRVGQTAPDFEATAYVRGEFNNVKLSDFKGQWVALCFYPADFTFV